MNASRLAELRDSLLALYDCARVLGSHAVAYHALAGALSAAEQLNDENTLELVESHARRHAAQDGSFEPLAKRAAELKQKGRPQAPSEPLNAPRA
jgi:hypothetical protein